MYKNLLVAALLLLGLLAGSQAHAQRWQEAWELLKMRQPDTARMVIDLEVDQPPGKDLAMAWYVRGMVYKTLYDRDDYQDKYTGENIDLTAYDSYKRAIALDRNQELTEGILEDLTTLTEDFCQTGLNLFEKGYDERNGHMLARAARYLDCVSESFDILGPRQVAIHKVISEYGINRRTLEVCRALAKDYSGSREEAVQLYEELVRQKTSEPAVYLNLKDYYAGHSARGQALAVLEAGRKQAPKSLELNLAYAELLADTGRFTEALALSRALARANPEEPGPLTSAGFIEERRGLNDRAEADYLQALMLEPTDFMANFRLGKLYFKRGEEAKGRSATQLYIRELQRTALSYAELAAAQDPKHPGNLRILYELYQTLGQADRAKETRLMMN